MQKWFFVFLLTTTASASVTISYTAANDLVLSSISCDELIKQHEAICSWNKTPLPSKLCRKTQSGFAVTVSSCLPTFVKANQHKKNYKSGANCWGTAMSFKKHALKPRFIWSHEMQYWLDTPLCRKLSVGEKKLPGDFLNIFGPEHVFAKDEPSNKGEKFWEALYPGRVTASPVDYGYSGYHHFLHTETFITDLITFGKDSPSKDDKFEFHNMNEVYGRSGDSECQENQAMEPYYREYQKPPREIRDSKCAYFSLAYRCENFQEYFKTQELDELLITQEKLFPLLTVLGTKFSQTQIDSMVKMADEKAEEALNELSRSSLEKKEEMLIVWKYFSAAGIRKSLELADLIPPTEEL
jgi:hypothetical protein